jgi:hypothetical protein
LGLHSHLPLHSPAKGKEVKPLKRMANGKAGSFAFAFAICHSLKQIGKWQRANDRRRLGSADFNAKANGKWQMANQN